MASCKELIELEPDASKRKWPLLTLARLYRLQAAQQGQEESQSHIQNPLNAEAAALFQQLIEIDPKRAGYYRDELACRTSVVLSKA